MSQIEEQNKYPPDMTPKEIADLERFIEEGMPGVALSADQIATALNLYLNGASYHEISIKLGVKKHIITYHSWKFKFYETKIETLAGLVQAVQNKVEIAGVKGIDLMMDVMNVLELYYRDVLNKYMLTKDRRVIENADFEKFKLFMKCMETIHKLKNPDDGNKNKTPTMGLNLPNGGILKKIDDNTVEVSPLNSTMNTINKLGDALKALSEFREKKESK
jgi:hypothetical protein